MSYCISEPSAKSGDNRHDKVNMRRDLDTLTTREHDVLIVGGGIIGASAAWDAAQRGLSVALVEGADFSSGTSWNSLKTIHGGLRYLQKLDWRRMRQSIGDRRALLRIAPKLVTPLPFLVPTYGHGLHGREALWAALRLNDLIARDRNRELPAHQRIPNGRVLAPEDVLARVPDIDRRGLTGGALWCDAQVSNSERLVIAMLGAAWERGACLANYCEVKALLKRKGRVSGVRVVDRENGNPIEIRARITVLATGPWTESLLLKSGIAAPRIPLLRASNVVLKRPLVEGLALGTRSGGRYLFAVPWRGRAIIGTEYVSLDTASENEMATFIDEAARAFPWAQITPDDVTLVHRGLVPGQRDASGLWTRDRITDHAAAGVPGLVSVIGVKYTTARDVARSVIDLVFRRLERRSPPCRTATTVLEHMETSAATVEEATRRAVEREMALRLSDVVMRRTELGSAGPCSEAEIDVVGRIMAEERGWNEARLNNERSALARLYATGWELAPPFPEHDSVAGDSA